MPGPTRGFLGRRRTASDPRLPPGQYDVGGDWPVLTAGFLLVPLSIAFGLID